MLLTSFLLYFFLGAFVGFLGALFGIGGGLLVIPLLVIFFGFDQQMAQGTALIMVVPNVILSLRNYHKRDKINIRYALSLSIPSFFLSFLGAYVALTLQANKLQNIFAIFMFFLAIYSISHALFRKKTVLGTKESAYGFIWFVVLGGTCGFLGGIFAVGAGAIATPVLTLVFGLAQLIAQSLALSLALPSLLASLFMYLLHGQVNWAVGIPLVLGGLTSVGFGVRLAYALPPKLLKILYGCFLLVCGLLLLIK